MLDYEFLQEDAVSAADLGDVLRLLAQLTKSPKAFGLEYLRAVTQSVRFLIARDLRKPRDGASEIVGMGCLAVRVIPTGPKGYIDDVVVAEESRGKGIGRALTQKLIAEARQLGLCHIELTSGPEREEANLLYPTLGFMRRQTNVWRLDLS